MLKITREHINAGEPGNPTKCPVSLACSEMFPEITRFYTLPQVQHNHPNYEDVKVKGFRITAFRESSVRYRHRRNYSFFVCDESAHNWLCDYDNLKDVQPINLDIDLRKHLEANPFFLY